MFGLDARIALGIFAILAMVTGFLAFGRIQTARDTKLVKQLQTIEESLEAYQADMGTFYLFTLNKDKSEDGVHDIEALWDKDLVLSGFQKNWNGPYLHRTSRRIQPYGNLSVFYAQPDRQNTCTTDSECYLWLALSNVPEKIWLTVNRIYDEAGGKMPENPTMAASLGRLQADEATDPRMLILRTIARPQ
ncbi:MAG: hypothetical protein COY40_03440 [Alphaproteobacteria bacterium CG_4_10_14_0_8_um_filter_53_9]|nr:MAG: hypothetical protein COY40_03440 [Alphaproteobacteria bacterium CG_4_10_14_0_8_um_filter_53_9]